MVVKLRRLAYNRTVRAASDQGGAKKDHRSAAEVTDGDDRCGVSMPSQSLLSLSLLGPFRALIDEKPVTAEFRNRKDEALLAYLAVETDRPHRRDALAELLWPERPEGVARASLRQALSEVRRAVGSDHLLTTRATVRFNTASRHWVDVAVYRAHLQATRNHADDDPATCPICMGHLQQAVALYRGDFLADLVLDDSREFQEWLTLQRERLFRQQVDALHRLTLYRRALRDLERARRYARRWVELDPWSERAHRELMAVLALSGERRAALDQYESCRRILAEELSEEPAPQTVMLHEQILDGTIGPTTTPPSTLPRHNLPKQLTPFVGRERELGHVRRLLSRPECRLLTVTGPGGVGKTRLALRAAEQAYAADIFADGVWFVPLDRIPSPERLVVTIARALGVATEATLDPSTQLLDHLKPRTLMLVLDNVEHLIRPATIPILETGDEDQAYSVILEILRQAPGVKIVVTSRERLNCQTEFLVTLEGLPHPDRRAILPEKETEVIKSFEAVRLLLERAGRARAGFTVTAETVGPIARICQLVDGLPLGIELAAASLERRTSQQVAEAIQQGLDTLAAPLRDLPPRHRSMRAVFEHSWRLLSDLEQATYRRLSVFQGSFDAEAAWAVADGPGEEEEGSASGSLPLEPLVDKSLLRLDALGRSDALQRYDLHPLLRQFAADKLAEHPEEEAATRRRHSLFYLALLREREEVIAGEHGQKALDEIQREMGNVQAALAWGAAHDAIEALREAAPALSYFYNRAGLFREGETVFGTIVEQLLGAPAGAESPVTTDLVARLRLEQARFLFGLGKYARIPEYTEAAITLAAARQDRALEAQAELIRGYVHLTQSDLSPARGCFERALSLSRTSGRDAGWSALESPCAVEANSLNSLAMVSKRQGRYDEAERYLALSLRVAREGNDRAGECRALNGLGSLALRRGALSQALASYQEALEAARACGDRRLEGSLLNNLGNIHLHLGMYGQAATHYSRALESHCEIDARQNEIPPRFNLGLVHHHQGQQDVARTFLHEALQIAQEIGDRRAQALAWLGIGHALKEMGSLDQARAAYEKAMTVRRDLGQTHLRAEPLAGLARVCLAHRDLEQAQAHVEEILEYLASGGTLEGAIAPFQIYLTCYRVLEASQDPRARETLERAHSLLQEQAANITDETMRRSFLENVAAHRELVEAFRQRRDSRT